LKIKDLQKLTSFKIVKFEKFEQESDDDTDDDTDARFTKVRAVIAHTGVNLNKSDFSKEVLENMIPSLSNVPIVGFIMVNDDNTKDFKAHEERYIITENGISTEYLGRMYGVIPESNNARFEFIEVDGVEREYLVCDGVIMNKFGNAKEIFDNDIQKGQSMELELDSFEGEFDSVEKIFKVTSAKFEALCILGDSSIPAMVGGLIEKTQFTRNNLQSVLEEIEYANKFTQNNERGDTLLDIKTLEEILKNYQYVSTEFVEEIKGKLDTYETKDNLEEILKKENEVQFALTIGAKQRLLKKDVEELEVLEDRYYSESRYSFKDVDFEMKEVYVIDYSDYMTYGFTFTEDGDRYKIDINSKFAILWQPVRIEEGTSTNFAVDEVAKTIYEKSIKEIENAKVEVSTEYETKIVKIKADYEAKIEEKDTELKRLASFESESLKKDKLDYVSKIENLDEVEKETLIDKITDFTIETLEEEVIKMIGRKNLKFSVAKENPIKDDFIPNQEPKAKSHKLDNLFLSDK